MDTDTESYTSVPEDPMEKPIRFWDLIEEEIVFLEVPDIGSGIFYKGSSPFGAGFFIDENNILSQIRPTQEGAWKSECTYNDDYRLLFRLHEGQKYMYLA